MFAALGVALFATSEPALPDVYSPFLQFGVLGATVVALGFFSATGVIAWRPFVLWLLQKIEQQQDTNDKLLAANQQAIPALAEAVTAMKTLADVVSEVKREQVALRDGLRADRDELRAEIRDLSRGH